VFFSSVKVTPVSSAHLQSTKRRRIEIRTADGIKICIFVVLEKSEERSKEHERGGRAMKKKVKIKTECDYGSLKEALKLVVKLRSLRSWTSLAGKIGLHAKMLSCSNMRTLLFVSSKYSTRKLTKPPSISRSTSTGL
jgi:hypothetical protein